MNPGFTNRDRDKRRYEHLSKIIWFWSESKTRSFTKILGMQNRDYDRLKALQECTNLFLRTNNNYNRCSGVVVLLILYCFAFSTIIRSLMIGQKYIYSAVAQVLWMERKARETKSCHMSSHFEQVVLSTNVNLNVLVFVFILSSLVNAFKQSSFYFKTLWPSYNWWSENG